MKTFIEKLGGREHIEISDLRKVFYSRNTKNILKSYSHKDLFILGGVKKGLTKRAGNKDIEFKTYFYLDFDIRSKWKELYGEIICQKDLYGEIYRLRNILNQDEYLSEWSYIICSGNGAHVYYCSETAQYISQENFSYSLKKVFEIFNKYIKEEYPHIKHFVVDEVCSNIARPGRLPGSINHKNRYGLGYQKVITLDEQDIDSRLVSHLSILGNTKSPTRKSLKKRKKRRHHSSYYVDVKQYKVRDVLERYLGKRISEKMIRCIFEDHRDTEASFSINDAGNYWNCFGCSRGGDSAKLISHIEGVSYKEATQILKNLFHKS